MSYEVDTPILNSPFTGPSEYWFLREDTEPQRRQGRRPAIAYPPRDQETAWDLGNGVLRPSQEFAPGYEMVLVNRVRERLAEWRKQGYPGVTRTTQELLNYWYRDGRARRLFFAQLEAAEAVIFLREARPDFLQGLTVPADEPTDQQKLDGIKAFTRYACKMATGSGKTTVMGMLAAWSILNKVHNRSDARFSDVVLVVCPNVTIRDRLMELDPDRGAASLYRSRDLVPDRLMDNLRQGRILITNWHVFEKRTPQTIDTPARVIQVGVPVQKTEIIHIGSKNDTARGKRYLTLDSYHRQVALGQLRVAEGSEKYDASGNLQSAKVVSFNRVESDTAWIQRILGREVGGKQNILVLNDEAHHAYRIYPGERDDDDDDEDADYDRQEATIWIEGLDRIHKHRGINLCVDLSATPYFLRQAGRDTNKPFPWIISDFSLTDAIESGLVKIPQLAIRDTTGQDIPGYFNIWKWVMEKLSSRERGAKKANPKPEAILKYAQHPIAMLAGLWEEKRLEWEQNSDDPRPPVFILVCKNTTIAKVIYEWLAESVQPADISPCKIDALRNRDGKIHTIRVDSKVVHEMNSGASKSDESRWLRYTLDTVGQWSWPSDLQGNPVYPEGFESLAHKLQRPLFPPGRDIRCVVSVGMLTEGWDCNTVTHIIGLRPFMSQLLCEQVVGRGLRRASYDLNENDRFEEETAKIFGVPFDLIPYKANPSNAKPKKEQRHRVYAVPAKAEYRIEVPRVDGYTQAVRNRITVDWDAIAPLKLDPSKIAPEVQVKATLPNNQGKPSLLGPGKLESLDLNPYRKARRLQELVFDIAAALTRELSVSKDCQVPPHALFPQLYHISDRYLREKVQPIAPAQTIDVFLSPYYGWVIEQLRNSIRPDTEQGEAPEVPRYEFNRGASRTDDINLWTTKPIYEVVHSHVNAVVADTQQWEQSAAYLIDTHPVTRAFVKNAGFNFAIPYFYDGRDRDYIPDFVIRLQSDIPSHLILEIKGRKETIDDFKKAAAERWVAAVNADGRYGHWQYVMCALSEVREVLDRLLPDASRV